MPHDYEENAFSRGMRDNSDTENVTRADRTPARTYTYTHRAAASRAAPAHDMGVAAVLAAAVLLLIYGQSRNFNVKYNKDFDVRVRRAVRAYGTDDLTFEPSNTIDEDSTRVVGDVPRPETVVEEYIDTGAYETGGKPRVFNIFRIKRSNDYSTETPRYATDAAQLQHLDFQNDEILSKRSKRSLWSYITDKFNYLTGRKETIYVTLTEKPIHKETTYENYKKTSAYNNGFNSQNDNNMDRKNDLHQNYNLGSNYNVSPNYESETYNSEDSAREPSPEPRGSTASEQVPTVNAACAIYCGAVNCPTGYKRVGMFCVRGKAKG